MDILNNKAFYFKYTLIIGIVFAILKFIVELKMSEALLLTSIILVSLLIIENIMQINDYTKDPFGCDSCKVNLNNSNEHFQVNTTSTTPTTTSSSDNTKIVNSIDGDGREYICYPLQSNTTTVSTNNVSVPASTTVSSVNTNFSTPNITASSTSQDFNANANQNNNATVTSSTASSFLTDLINNSLSETQPNVNVTMSTASNVPMNTTVTTTSPTTTVINTTPNNFETFLVEQQHSIINGEGVQEININREDVKTNFTPSMKEPEYVTYQNNGDERKDQTMAKERKMFRLREGNPDVVNSYVASGKKTYQDIYTRSDGSIDPKELETDEYKYGDFNYIAPTNRGMIDKTYTMVSPNNWYPIAPHPPVCVTNKKCVTSPVIISDGNNYMNYANITEFDQARRFTGNMNINVDYVKNILNSDNGY